MLGALGEDQEAGQYRWGERGGGVAFTILFVILHWLRDCVIQAGIADAAIWSVEDLQMMIRCYFC